MQTNVRNTIDEQTHILYTVVENPCSMTIANLEHIGGYVMSTCSSIGDYKNYSLGSNNRNRTHRNSHTRVARNRKKRRQVLSYCITVLLILSSIVWFIWDWHKTTEIVDSLIYQPYVVQSGDTLWALASNSGTGLDTRTLVQKIMEYNQLNDSTIQTGQLIYTPTSYKLP